MAQQSAEMNTRFIDNSLSELDKANKSPIFGYQHMPVVTLEEAIETLIPHVPGLVDYAAIAKQRCNQGSSSLTLHESAAIFLYSMQTPFFALLNKNLRAENRHALKPWFSFLKLFMTALEKLPSLRVTVWRGISSNISSSFGENTVLTWWTVNSCSKALDVVQLYLGDVGTLLAIEAYNAKDISEFSRFPQEQEFIVMPGTCLKVKPGLLNFQDHLFIVHLEEEASCVQKGSSNATNQSQPSCTNRDVNYDIQPNWRTPDVSLNSMKYNDQDVDIIANALRTNRHWRELRLGKNEIGDPGATSLAIALEFNATLTTLALSFNQVGNIGAIQLAHALKKNCTLRKLYLSENNVSEEGACELAEMLKVNKSLTLLNLEFNPLSDAGALPIIEALSSTNRSLQCLCLGKTNITFAIADAIAHMLQTNTYLKKLSLDENLMGDAGMQSFCLVLSENTTLKEFNICNNEITDISTDYIMAVIKCNRSLKQFQIMNNKFSEQGKTKLEQAAEQNQFRLNTNGIFLEHM